MRANFSAEELNYKVTLTKVHFILEKLKKYGFEAYLVGGCVRDALLNKTPKDIDICTNALPEQVKLVFADEENISFVDTGLKHGTITLYFPDKEGFEITTYRIDKEYIDNRHCEVEFTSDLKEDLLRRDFTINALAYNYDKGLQDYFEGKEDLNNKIIRCVGIPDERFNEDGLRILRALRFKTQLDFEIEKKTEKSLLKNAHLLNCISKERIRDELNKILSCKNCYKTFNKYIDIFKNYVFCTDDIGDLKEDKEFLMNCDFTKEIYLAYLFRNLNIEKVLSIMSHENGLKYDNNIIRKIKNILLYVDLRVLQEDVLLQKVYLKRLINNVEEDVLDILSYLLYLSEDIEGYKKLIKLFWEIKQNECCKISDLVVNGTDLSNSHFEGKEIGYVLKVLFNEVIHERINNNIHSITHFLRENYRKLKEGVY